MSERNYMKQMLQRSLKSPDAILSMIIGLVVILSIGYAIITTIRTNRATQQEELRKAEEQKKLEEARLPKDIVVKEGENLWVISETYYKTGYNWVDIAEANKLENPDLIYPDQKLTIPDVMPRIVEEGDITPQAASTVRPKDPTYKVVSGDTLWDISIKEYGDGFHWPDIATKNQIPNPDLIFPEAVFQMP